MSYTPSDFPVPNVLGILSGQIPLLDIDDNFIAVADNISTVANLVSTGSGSQGAQGISGSDGAQGTQGAQGYTGSDGAQGVQGLYGIQGPYGSGSQGIQGISGSDAAQGSQGTQGSQGYTGSGSDGTQGTQGVQGIQGYFGNQGTQGIQGLGNVGTQGVQGIQGTSGGGSSTFNVDSDTHPSSPNVFDDEFEYGSSIDTSGARASGAVAWTAFNLGTGSTAISHGSLVFSPALTASRTNGGYSQPVSGTWTITAKLSYLMNNSDCGGGLALWDNSGASGEMIVFGGAGNSSLYALVQRLTNNSTFSANQLLTTNGFLSAYGSGVAGPTGTIPVYQRIQNDGTNLKFSISYTGIEGSFKQLYTETIAAFIGTVGYAGITYDNQDATNQSLLICDWIRKT